MKWFSGLKKIWKIVIISVLCLIVLAILTTTYFLTIYQNRFKITPPEVVGETLLFANVDLVSFEYKANIDIDYIYVDESYNQISEDSLEDYNFYTVHAVRYTERGEDKFVEKIDNRKQYDAFVSVRKGAEAIDAEKREQENKKKAKKINYRDLLKFGDETLGKVKGNYYKFTGEVFQDTEDNTFFVAVTKNGDYATYYTDIVQIVVSGIPSEKIIVDDIISFVGKADGNYKYTTTNETTNEIPSIRVSAEDIKFVK